MVKKIFSLDVGKVRIGVATLDDRGACVALKTIKRAQGEAVRALQEIFGGSIDALVVGAPLDDKEQLTDTAIDIFKFCRRLIRRSPSLPISFVDEYGTSAEAEMALGSSKSVRRSGEVDAQAARSILKIFLERGADERIAASFHAWLKDCIKDQK